MDLRLRASLCLLIAAVPAAVAPVAADAADAARLVWESPAELAKPESVVWDGKRSVYFVSSINGDATEASGTGFISKLGPNGEILQREWARGLNAPKGLALADNRLFVAEVGALVEIDADTGRIVARHKAEGSRFLNDVALDARGRVYVSDMMTDTLWRLDRGAFEPWLKSERLAGPNGLLVVGDALVVGSWGRMIDGFRTDVPGHLLVVSLVDKTLRDLGDGQPFANVDGVESDGAGGYFLTDWMAGRLLHVPATGALHTVLQLQQGTADLNVRLDQQLAVIPLMNENKVAAFRLSP